MHEEAVALLEAEHTSYALLESPPESVALALAGAGLEVVRRAGRWELWALP